MIRLLWVFFLMISLMPRHLLFAQSDLYSFPEIKEAPIKKPTPKKAADPFILLLSKKMNVQEAILSNAASVGFGRSELIRLILISQKGGKDLEELIKERKNGTRLKKIAESAKLDHKLLRKESNKILTELENQQTAGVSNQNYELKKSTS